MAAIKWYAPTSVQTIFAAADLQSDGSGVETTSAEYDNSSALDMFADFQLALQWDSVLTGIQEGTRVADLYLIAALDGTQYPNLGSSGLPQRALFIGAFAAVAPSLSALDYMNLMGVQLPPGKFKFVISNVSGQAWDPLASMFLKMRPYQLQSV